MNKSSPWSAIEIPRQDFNVRKVADTRGLNLYWGKDKLGQCLFIVELTGDQAELFRKSHVHIQGIKTDLRLIDTTSSQGLVVTLEKHVDQDLFSAMCQTLVAALREIDDSATGLSVAMSQIKRWKAFMAGKKRAVLSAEEIRGLFGELSFLQIMWKHGYQELAALQAWEGPEGTHQDFIFENTAVEIKCLSGRERNSVRISSEDQLESLNDRLFLKIFRLTEMPESDRSLSLNGLVQSIESEIQDHEAIELFYDKLAKAGYVELHEYDSPEFIISEDSLYLVTEEFPRLVRSELPDGITKVRYELELERIGQFQTENEVLWEK